MTKQQNNKRTMFESVLSLIETNNTSASSFPGITESVGTFRGLMQEIHNKTVVVQQVAVGKAIAKQEAREALIALLVPVQAGLFAYARKQGDGGLKAKVGTAPSQFRGMRATVLASAAEGILKLAKENAENLDIHGATAEMLAALEGAVQAFTQAIGEREASVAARVAGRTGLKDLFAEIDAVLGQEIDRYLEFIRQNDPDFYASYFEARVVKNMGIRHKETLSLVAEQSTPKAA